MSRHFSFRERGIALAALVMAGSVLLGRPVYADERTVGTVAEAWYQPCGLPAGCDALPSASQYPAQTFHIAFDGGAESARTYLQLDLDAVPAGADLTGGTLVLPLAEEGAGTTAPDTADVVACVAPEAVEPVEGSFAPPPEIDCSASAAAVFDAGTNAFRVDLTSLAPRWTSDVASIALVPADGAEGSWRVVVSGHDRDGSAPPTAVLTFDTESDAAAPVPTTATTRPAPPMARNPVDEPFSVAAPMGPTVGLPEAAVDVPPAAPVLAEPTFTGGQPGPSSRAVAYPAVWLLPLGLLVVGGLIGSVLTRPITVKAHVNGGLTD